MNHPGLEEAPFRGVGTGGNHMGLSPINRMTRGCVCYARAEVARSPLVTALQCSLRRCVRVLPVCPMYA